MPKLTDLSVRSLPQGIHWDSSLRGFGLRVGKNRRAWVILVASGRRRSIGAFPHMGLAEARKVAKSLLAAKVLGHRVPERVAFEDAAGDFLTECEQRLRPSTMRSYRQHLRRHFPFKRQALADVTPRQILRELNPLSPGEREHAFRVGGRFFRWCVRQHLIGRSPMENMAIGTSKASRTRVLNEEEVRAVYALARASPGTFERIVALLLLTGQRRGEISRLEWSWIKDDSITLPVAVTKNRREHTFPIGPEAQAILASVPRFEGVPYVFPASRQSKPTTTVFNGWGKPKATFDKECGVSGWTLHDLRRTFSSGMAALGVPQIVVEKLLNHVSGGTQSPIAQVYNRYSYMDEMREAMLQWEAYLATLCAPEA